MTLAIESFTGANNASLAAADVDLTWANVVAGWSVASNQAAAGGVGAVQYGRAEVDAGSADMFAEVVIASYNDGSSGDIAQCGPLARFSSSANNCYMVVRGLDTADQIAIRRTVTGSRTTIASANVTRTPGETIRIEAEGTAIRGYVNGVLAVSATDSTITTGERGGIYGYRPADGAVALDSFRVGPLSGGDPEPTAFGLGFFAAC